MKPYNNSEVMNGKDSKNITSSKYIYTYIYVHINIYNYTLNAFIYFKNSCSTTLVGLLNYHTDKQ